MAASSVAVAADEQSAARRSRWERRHDLWRVSKARKLQTCGRATREESVDVLVATEQDGTRRAAVHGLVTCSSIWSCPVCSAHIRAERAQEVARAVELHREAGGGVAFVTLTLRHEDGEGLGELLDALYGSWRSVQQSRGWRDQADMMLLVGWIRAAEITYGQAGWHPHLHLLLFTAAPIDRAGRAKLEAWITARWLEALQAHGRDGLVGIAVNVRQVSDDPSSWERLAGYTTKGETVHHELARGDRKRPWRGESWSPFEILEAAGWGEKWALDRWWEYERVTHRRRAIEWSRGSKHRPGLRELLGLGEERADDDITGDSVAETAEDVEVVASIPGPAWLAVCAVGADHDVVEAAEADGGEGVELVVARALAARRDRGRANDRRATRRRTAGRPPRRPDA